MLHVVSQLLPKRKSQLPATIHLLTHELFIISFLFPTSVHCSFTMLPGITAPKLHATKALTQLASEGAKIRQRDLRQRVPGSSHGSQKATGRFHMPEGSHTTQRMRQNYD
jgi:hypothetical protein